MNQLQNLELCGVRPSGDHQTQNIALHVSVCTVSLSLEKLFSKEEASPQTFLNF